MSECPECGLLCKSPQGLASHRNAKHPVVLLPNVVALDKTLGVLREMGRLEPIDAARVQTLRSLAKSVDRWPDEAQLWRQYREALREVLDADNSASEELEKALADIRSMPAVGNT